jgi:DNA-binding transcriptional ArsR family regulator
MSPVKDPELEKKLEQQREEFRHKHPPKARAKEAAAKAERAAEARKKAEQTRKRAEQANGRGTQNAPGSSTTTQSTVSAEELMSKIFEPIKYVVPGIIVEGLTLFTGKPKVGKSWLLLHAAIAVARGGFTLGDIKCLEGDVLYCALEDNERRLQSRLTKLLGLQSWPARLKFRCEMPRLAQGGLDQIKEWLKAADHPRLVIIDTLAMVRAPNRRDQSTYDADYAAVASLRALANEYGVAIVLVHHLRKADADDPLDTISGTLGLTGAPDTILVLTRDASGHFVLHGRGRDLIEIEKAISFNADACIWTIMGDVAVVRMTSERGAIVAALEEAAEPIGPNDIAAATDMKPANVRYLLGRLVKDGIVEKLDYGRYRLLNPSHPSHSPHTQATPLM